MSVLTIHSGHGASALLRTDARTKGIRVGTIFFNNCQSIRVGNALKQRPSFLSVLPRKVCGYLALLLVTHLEISNFAPLFQAAALAPGLWDIPKLRDRISDFVPCHGSSRPCHDFCPPFLEKNPSKMRFVTTSRLFTPVRHPLRRTGILPVSILRGAALCPRASPAQTSRPKRDLHLTAANRNPSFYEACVKAGLSRKFSRSLRKREGLPHDGHSSHFLSNTQPLLSSALLNG